jgi:hypothetical protein
LEHDGRETQAKDRPPGLFSGEKSKAAVKMPIVALHRRSDKTSEDSAQQREKVQFSQLGARPLVWKKSIQFEGALASEA